MSAPRVIVGIDAHSAEAAVDFAAAEAAARGVELDVVGTYETFLSDAWTDEQSQELQRELRAVTAGQVAETVERLRTRWPELPVVSESLEHPAARALVARSSGAAVLVVGSHRFGTTHRVFLGSVSAAVAARGRCPVVVVPPAHLRRQPMIRAVVVGVDAIPESKAVLGFAFDHASRHGLPLRAVLCVPTVLRPTPHGRRAADLRVRAERWLAEALAGWQETYPDVPVTRTVALAHAAPTLVGESRSTTLLVVGRHGHSAVAGMLLGSVSQAVVQHAAGPVAVVPV